jgi:hypothetical protein
MIACTNTHQVVNTPTPRNQERLNELLELLKEEIFVELDRRIKTTEKDLT